MRKEKFCNKCQTNKQYIDFCKRAGRKDGLNSTCKACSTESTREWRKLNKDKLREKRKGKAKKPYILTTEIKQRRLEWRNNNREKLRQRNVEYRKNNKAKTSKYRKAYYEKNKEILKRKQKDYLNTSPDKVKESKNKWLLKNKEKRKEVAKKCMQKHAGKVNARTAKYRAALLQATPKWLTKQQLLEIQEWYTLCEEIQWLSEERLEVDHIMPLRGKNSCGLHVPWNLQILPASLNRTKSNKILPLNFDVFVIT